MKNRGFFAGLLCGALIFGGTTAYAAGIVANLSTQPIYLNGQQVSMTAYNINGNNYVKLRDIGEKVGFNVYWDDGVQIDSDADYTGVAPTSSTTAVTIPQSDAKLTLKVGDTVQCDDGTTYAITDMSRYDKSAFSADPLGALPTATCDYAKFSALTLPKAEARRFQSGGTDYLFIRNLYETRRMQYTLYNAIGANEQTWANGAPKLRGDGTPVARVQLFISDDTDAESFWPWRADQITADFESCPPGFYQLEAWDAYANGKYLYTEYRVAVGI